MLIKIDALVHREVGDGRAGNQGLELAGEDLAGNRRRMIYVRVILSLMIDDRLIFRINEFVKVELSIANSSQ